MLLTLERGERQPFSVCLWSTTPQLKLRGPDTTQISKGSEHDSNVGSQLVLLSEMITAEP